jgi:hypothetical protein
MDDENSNRPNGLELICGEPQKARYKDEFETSLAKMMYMGFANEKASCHLLTSSNTVSIVSCGGTM